MQKTGLHEKKKQKKQFDVHKLEHLTLVTFVLQKGLCGAKTETKAFRLRTSKW